LIQVFSEEKKKQILYAEKSADLNLMCGTCP
jgi:hypothetical protein